MSGEALEREYETLCRLLAAWVNGVSPGIGEIPDFEALFEAADRHSLSAAACFALERAGLMDRCPAETAERFQRAKVRSVRKTLLMDAERGKVLAFLEERGIWYAPVKGAALNGLYPVYGSRQFADSDILIDADRWREVRDFMKDRGYRAEGVGQKNHDAYFKPPVYYFEMHRLLFAGGETPFLTAAAKYYERPLERLVRDGDGFGYHFTDEDFYIYFLVHAYKHYHEGGTGLRTVLDGYLCRRARPDMDEPYVAGELKKLGLTRFDDLLRSLGEKLFGPPPAPALTRAEREALAWIESSGVYGTMAHQVQNGLRRNQEDGGAIGGCARARYLFRKLFPAREWYRFNAPFAGRHPWAIPLAWARRLGRGLFVNGRRNLKVLGKALGRDRRDGEEGGPG